MTRGEIKALALTLLDESDPSDFWTDAELNFYYSRALADFLLNTKVVSVFKDSVTYNAATGRITDEDIQSNLLQVHAFYVNGKVLDIYYPNEIQRVFGSENWRADRLSANNSEEFLAVVSEKTPDDTSSFLLYPLPYVTEPPVTISASYIPQPNVAGDEAETPFLPLPAQLLIPYYIASLCLKKTGVEYNIQKAGIFMDQYRQSEYFFQNHLYTNKEVIMPSDMDGRGGGQ